MKSLMILIVILVGGVTHNAGAQSQPEDGFTGKRFGNWSGHCRTSEDSGATRCALLQVVSTAQNNKKTRILSLTAGYFGPQNQAAMWVEVPLGSYLPANLQLNVPGEEPVNFVYETCQVSGCRGRILLPDTLLGALTRAESASVTVQNMRRQLVQLPFSLIGFAVGFGSLPQTSK